MKSSVRISIEHFDESTTHQQLHHEIITDIERNSKTIYILNKIL